MTLTAVAEVNKLRAPFPYFGGKSSVAHLVWAAVGQPKHYLEPFFGSGAVLLARPEYRHGTHIETVNDANGNVCNVWRSLRAAPDAVAALCDWPVNHLDLSARKTKILDGQDKLKYRLAADPDYYDAKLAGYWIWAASCWIGSGLDSIGQRPHLSSGGKGVHALGQRPHLSGGGQGVHALGQLTHLSDGGQGYNNNIYRWFRQLSERLRYVRVICGDWIRVCGGDWQDGKGIVGLFFDPPYAVTDRDTDIYAVDSTSVANDVREWCIERGNRRSYRIVLAGYEEHEDLLSHGWTSRRWTAQGGYGNLTRNSNRRRETLYFSPHCVGQKGLFACA